MLKRIVLGLSLSVLVLAPVHASAMELIDDYRPSQQASVVLNHPASQEVKAGRSYSAQAYEIVDNAGLTNLVKGTGNLAVGGGRIVKDAGYLGIGAVETLAALGYVAKSPLDLVYGGREAAGKSLQSAKDYGYAAYDNAKTAVSDMPANYQNAKTGLVELYQGGAKLLGSAWSGINYVANSAPVQSAWSGAKSWLGSAWNAAKETAVKAAGSVVSMNFDKVDFS